MSRLEPWTLGSSAKALQLLGDGAGIGAEAGQQARDEPLGLGEQGRQQVLGQHLDVMLLHRDVAGLAEGFLSLDRQIVHSHGEP